MRLFARLADRVLAWGRLPRAPALLCFISFAESIVFPIAVDVMLAPMCVAQPRKWMRLAGLTTIFSVAGGLAGLTLGYLAIEAVTPWLEELGWGGAYSQVQHWYQRWGYWALVLAAFTPLPYKVFAISAGALHMHPGAFLAASLLGRGLRFFLVAALAAWLGPKALEGLHRYPDRVGWALMGAVVLLVALWWRW